jgi:hypothetical protein
MKRKIYILAIFSLFTVLNTRIVSQGPHKVIGSRIGNVSIVFWNSEITALWIDSKMFIPATKADYENL